MPDQLLIFYQDYPTFDPAALAKTINTCDTAEGEDCIAEQVDQQIKPSDDSTRKMGLGDEPLRIGTLLLSLGEFHLSVITHNLPAPDISCIEHSRLREPLKERLRQHKAFALLTLTGGEEYAPIERVVFLFKTALALVQDPTALGIGCPGGQTALDRDVFLQMVEAPKRHESTLWAALRLENVPIELFTNILRVDHEGTPWFVTFGHNLLRLPDLALKSDAQVSDEEAVELLHGIRGYLLENGPVIQPGHRLGGPGKAYVASDPPEDLEFLKREMGLLVISAA